MLEEEVYGDASPIWDPEFSQANVNNTGFSLLNFIEKKQEYKFTRNIVHIDRPITVRVLLMLELVLI